MWYGKVNQHNENGTWMTDPDGVAGAGLYSQWGSEGWGDRKLEYCQRFWPDTVEIRNSAPEEIVFYTRGNTDAYLTMKPVWLCVQDTDGDGILDPEDDDDDGDGWPDIFEDLCFSDALDPNVMDLRTSTAMGCATCFRSCLLATLNRPSPASAPTVKSPVASTVKFWNENRRREITELVVVEKTGGTNQYQYEIHDWSNGLHEDLQQDASNHDFRMNNIGRVLRQGLSTTNLGVGHFMTPRWATLAPGFLSDADGTFNPNGSFVTVQARSDLSTTNLGVGHNIDAIGIRDANGNVLYASEVLAVVLGDGLGVDNPDGPCTAILMVKTEIAIRRSPGSCNNQGFRSPVFCPNGWTALRRWTGLRCHGRTLPSARRCSLAAEACWTSKTLSDALQHVGLRLRDGCVEGIGHEHIALACGFPWPRGGSFLLADLHLHQVLLSRGTSFALRMASRHRQAAMPSSARCIEHDLEAQAWSVGVVSREPFNVLKVLRSEKIEAVAGVQAYERGVVADGVQTHVGPSFLGRVLTRPLDHVAHHVASSEVGVGRDAVQVDGGVGVELPPNLRVLVGHDPHASHVPVKANLPLASFADLEVHKSGVNLRPRHLSFRPLQGGRVSIEVQDLVPLLRPGPADLHAGLRDLRCINLSIEVEVGGEG